MKVPLKKLDQPAKEWLFKNTCREPDVFGALQKAAAIFSRTIRLY